VYGKHSGQWYRTKIIDSYGAKLLSAADTGFKGREASELISPPPTPQQTWCPEDPIPLPIGITHKNLLVKCEPLSENNTTRWADDRELKLGSADC